jgi:hypothetical protein
MSSILEIRVGLRWLPQRGKVAGAPLGHAYLPGYWTCVRRHLAGVGPWSGIVPDHGVMDKAASGQAHASYVQ